MSVFFRTGTSSLSRVFCVKCLEETIHRKGACIHCQTVRGGYEAIGVGPNKFWNWPVSKAGRELARKHKR
jgi:hypothetical protein